MKAAEEYVIRVTTEHFSGYVPNFDGPLTRWFGVTEFEKARRFHSKEAVMDEVESMTLAATLARVAAVIDVVEL